MAKRRTTQSSTGPNGNGAAPGQRTQRTSRKLNRRKVQELAKQGMSTTDISQHQQVAPSTVWRFLQQLKPQQEQLNQFKEHRADCLAQIQGKALNVQGLVLDRLTNDLQDDGLINALTPTAKTKILHAAALVGGISFDKERLTRDQSTENMALLGNLVIEAHKHLTDHPAITGRTDARKTEQDSTDA